MADRGGQQSPINGDKFVTHKHLYAVLAGLNGALVTTFGIVYMLVSPISTSEFEQRTKRVDERYQQRREEVGREFTLLREDIRERWQSADKRLVTINDQLRLISDTIIRLEGEIKKKMP